MRVFLILVVMALTVGPAAAQSNPTKCKQVLDTISSMSITYRALLNDVNSLPTGNVVNSLSGEQQAIAKEWEAAHQALRPVLNQYVQRIEDLTYSLQTCMR